MDKQAGKEMVDTGLLGIFSDVNSRRFVNAVLAGVVGGAGVSAAANLLRNYRELRNAKKDETDDSTIVLNLPSKMASDGYTSMRDAKSGETKITANGSRQVRNDGKYGDSLGSKKTDKPEVKCALVWGDSGAAPKYDAGPNSVGTIVFNTLGLTAGGLLAYDVVSRAFDAMHERRLKKKLEAAQQAYISAVSGASKRAEQVLSVLNPVEHVLARETSEKTAGVASNAVNWLIDKIPGVSVAQYPTAFYILSLLAGTGASAYVTKKVMDREFPEEKLKKDINKPTRIVFRSTDTGPVLLEGAKGEEKAASYDMCAAVSAMLPIYQDIVEGAPKRTLEEPYVKLAEAAGTDPAGLMKMAQSNMMQVIFTLLQNPRALWQILRGTRFGLDFSKQKAVDILRKNSPDVYKTIVDGAISNRYSGNTFWDQVKKTTAQACSNFGGRDWMVDNELRGSTNWEMAKDFGRRAWGKIRGPQTPQTPQAAPGTVASNVPYGNYGGTDAQRQYVQPSIDNTASPYKAAEQETLLHSNYLGNAVFGGGSEPQDDRKPIGEKEILSRVRRAMKARQRITVSAEGPAAEAYVGKNKELIKKLITRLNASGSL